MLLGVPWKSFYASGNPWRHTRFDLVIAFVLVIRICSGYRFRYRLRVRLRVGVHICTLAPIVTVNNRL